MPSAWPRASTQPSRALTGCRAGTSADRFGPTPNQTDWYRVPILVWFRNLPFRLPRVLIDSARCFLLVPRVASCWFRGLFCLVSYLGFEWFRVLLGRFRVLPLVGSACCAGLVSYLAFCLVQSLGLDCFLVLLLVACACCFWLGLGVACGWFSLVVLMRLFE